jgi:hypothetical protein
VRVRVSSCEEGAIRVEDGLQLLEVGCEKACASLERIPADALSNSEQEETLVYLIQERCTSAGRKGECELDLPCRQRFLSAEISFENIERGRQLLQTLSQLIERTNILLWKCHCPD